MVFLGKLDCVGGGGALLRTPAAYCDNPKLPDDGNKEYG
jgi:hypothetical protein